MIKKDKRYKKVYTACVVVSLITLVCVIGLLIFFSYNKASIGQTNFLILTISLVLLIITSMIFAFASLFGYLNIPEVLVERKDDEITIFLPKNKQETIKIDSILNISIKKKLFARSTKVLIITTDSKEYNLEDVEKIDEGKEKLLEMINK